MTRRYLKLAIVGSIFTLSACAQQSEIRQMNQSVSTLSKEMTQLNQQTVKISAAVASGKDSATTDSYQEVNVQNQLISAPASVLAPSDVDIPLRLNGVTPEQVGFVRIHDIQPANTP